MGAVYSASGKFLMADAPAISVRGLYKIFGPDPKAAVDLVRQGMGKAELLEKHDHVLALRDINLNVSDRSIFVVMGLSGCGKSTLIRHFNRLIKPTAGGVEIGGRDILALSDADLRALRRNEVSMVFQHFALMPHWTVLDNVAYGRTVQHLPAADTRRRAKGWIERVGLAGCESQYPAQLSGGMQQRVGLARALTTDAGILLMDEPFSALDPLIRAEMQDMLLELQAELSKTIVFITHDLEEALKLGDRVAILRDGELVQQGNTQNIVLEPIDRYVEEFVKNINRGRVLQVGSIMSPLDGEEPRLSLRNDTVLEAALVALTREQAQSARVVDSSGIPVGLIELNALVQAMAPSTRA